MRLEAALFVVAVASAAASAAASAPAAESSNAEPLGGSSYSIIKDLLLKIIREIEGEKKEYLEKIEIAKNARLENILVESIVDKTTLDMSDGTATIRIKSFKVPVKRLQVKGTYLFEDLALPGGLTIYGNGEFTIFLEQLNLSLLLEATYKSATGKWTVKNVGVEAFLKSSLVEFENLMNGEPMGDFIHKMINQLIPVVVDLAQGLVEENKDPIMKLLSELINSLMPKFL